MITTDQLKDVLDRTDALYKYLKIDEKRMEYEEEDLRTQAPDFWEDQKRAEEQMKKVKGIKKWLDGYQAVRITRIKKHAPPEGGPHGCCAEDQLRSRWY